jgi:hypothetical protein
MQEFAEMKREGLSTQAISTLTGYDRKTVRKYLLEPEAVPQYGPRAAQPSKLDAHKPYLQGRLQAGVWNAQVLLGELVHGTPKDLAGARDLALRDKYQFQWWAVSLVNAIPFAGKKKGADSGIDGLIYFKGDGKVTEKAIVSVKGGENVGVTMIRDLAHVVDREKAKIGVFITLAEPTAPMKTESVKTGYYEVRNKKYPKIQILTIRELFEGKQPSIPLIDTGVFKKAEKEMTDEQEVMLFDDFEES